MEMKKGVKEGRKVKKGRRHGGREAVKVENNRDDDGKM